MRSPSFRHSTEVQTVLFDVSAFTPATAAAWARSHGFRAPAGDVTDRYIRLRQREPAAYRAGTFRTITLTDGVLAVVGVPKTGGNLKPRKNAGGSTRPTRTAQVTAYLAENGFPDLKLHKGAGYLYVSGGGSETWPETSIMTYRVSDQTLDQWLSDVRRLAGGARRNGSLSAARARLLAAETAYALLRSHHGGSMISWAQYKRTVARMSPEAILAEAREDVNHRNPRRNGVRADFSDLFEFDRRGFMRVHPDATRAQVAEALRQVDEQLARMAKGTNTRAMAGEIRAGLANWLAEHPTAKNPRRNGGSAHVCRNPGCGCKSNPRRNNETVPDCAWCGAECNQPRPYANWRGELFCSPSHRSSSNRALARLTGEGAPKKRKNGAERVTVPGMGTGVVVAHRPGGMCDIRLSGGQVVRKSKSTLKPA